MYSLLMGLWSLLFTRTPYQILMLGLNHAGKTTLLNHLRLPCTSHFHSHSLSHSSSCSHHQQHSAPLPTVGLNIGKVDIERSRLILWDLGGQSGLRVLWDKYFADAHAIVFVIDSTDIERLQEALHELSKLDGDAELVDAPFLIFANKQDALGAMRAHELELYIREACEHVEERRAFKIQEVSALNGDGIQKGVDWLLQQIQRAKRTIRISQRPQ